MWSDSNYELVKQFWAVLDRIGGSLQTVTVLYLQEQMWSFMNFIGHIALLEHQIIQNSIDLVFENIYNVYDNISVLVSLLVTRSPSTWSKFICLDMKGCICHFAKWQIHPFISKRTIWPKCSGITLTTAKINNQKIWARDWPMTVQVGVMWNQLW